MPPSTTSEPKAFALVNARVAVSGDNALTLPADGPTALAIEDGRIAHVGGDDAVRGLLGRRGPSVDVHGAVIAPGIVDSHIHAFDCAVASLGVSCLPPEVDSLAVLAQRLTDRAASRPAGAWVVATGYDDTRLSEHRHPSRADIDLAVPHHPAVVGRVCGHMSVANTLALAAAGISAATPDPPGGAIVRDASGAPTGLLLETAQDLVWRTVPPLARTDIKRALAHVGSQILGYGITAICEALLGASHPLEVGIWSELLSGPWEGPRTAFLSHPDATEAARTAGLAVVGTKLFADGVITGGTAAVSAPFEDSTNLGMLVHELGELTGMVRRSTARGLPVGIHAMGDRGIATALAAIERAGQSFPPAKTPAGKQPLHHRIEHCTLPGPESLAGMQRLGVIPVPQPVFLFAEGEAYAAQLGVQRSQRAYPLRTMISHRLHPALSSDAPATSWDDPINPWLGIAAAAARQTWAGSVLGTTEAVSAGEALHCYTANGARALGLGDRLGTIAVGKDADLLVLPRDPFTGNDPAPLAALRPTAVLIKGNVVHGALT
jgi:predicted amidohydrolase YtcJ